MSGALIKTRYQDEATAAAYDAERFSSFVGRTFDRLEKRALAALLRRVRRDLEDPLVLDVPCGTGRITRFLLDQGLSVRGGDVSLAMMDVARRKCACHLGRVQWQRLDLDCLDLEDDSVDVVTCIRLFHHLESDARAAILKEIARVTRRFVIVNVSFSSPVYRARRRMKQALGQGISRASSSSVEIAREAAAAGLSVEARRFVWPLMSEDLVLLLRKTGNEPRRR
jgi:ubiquinone/menaquinone biosynthesis C-methylase UbiE